MRKLLALIACAILCLPAFAQQPQTQDAPNYLANSNTTQGIGTGYYCRQQSGLILACTAATVHCNNTLVESAPQTITLADNSINYVFLDPTSSCALTANTTGFPDGAPRLYKITTSGGSFLTTAVDDVRSFLAVTTLQVSGTGNVFVVASDLSGTVGTPLCLDSDGNATNVGCNAAVGNPIRDCEITIGDPGSASPALANDNDAPAVCGNDFGVDYTITAVACWANAGSPTVLPILTGGGTILGGALTCGTASWAAGTISGTPTVHTFSSNGATCASTPCSIDANIATAGGTATYIVIRIKRSL